MNGRIRAPQRYGAYNLLDNSNFRDPVNQRGATSGGGSGYCVDRWFLWSPNGAVSWQIESGRIGVNSGTDDYGTLGQRFPKGYLSADKTYTLAHMDASGVIHINNDPINRTPTDYDYCDIHFEGWYGIQWAALYEGAYTADTLPPYVPKGYAAEMMECLRYLYKFADAGKGYAIPLDPSSDKKSFTCDLALPIPMVAAPSTIFTDGGMPRVICLTSANTYAHTDRAVSTDIYAASPVRVSVRFFTSSDVTGASFASLDTLGGGALYLSAEL